MIIATTAKRIPQLVVGRFILGSGTAFMVLGAPAYTTEIAPPQWRGRCTGEAGPTR
jgi:MFS family permease